MANPADGATRPLRWTRTFRYGVLMTPDHDILFPHLEDNQRARALEWLRGYLILVLRIQRECGPVEPSPLSTGTPLTDAEVMQRSVRLVPEPPSTTT